MTANFLLPTWLKRRDGYDSILNSSLAIVEVDETPNTPRQADDTDTHSDFTRGSPPPRVTSTPINTRWHTHDGKHHLWTSLYVLLTILTLLTIMTTVVHVEVRNSNHVLHEHEVYQEKLHTNTENTPHFYNEQLVDHTATTPTYWKHRYYESTTYFHGPGSPILLIVGGEGADNHGFLYPFVTQDLAKRYGAAVVQPEHRFYGPYPPIPYTIVHTRTLLDIFTPEQVMQDMLRLVTVHLRQPGGILEGCSLDRTSRSYCPLITIGASYPGFLSSLFRIVHPQTVDAAYAASAPLLMYAQVSPNTRYYDIVTEAAEKTSPGCAGSVRSTLGDIESIIVKSKTVANAAKAVGVCDGKLLPRSLKSPHGLLDALSTAVVYGFANFDMDNYPPGPNTTMYKMCQIFQDPNLDSVKTLGEYLKMGVLDQWEEDNGCDIGAPHCTDDMREIYLKSVYDGRSCYNMKPELDNDVPDTSEEVYDGHGYDDRQMWDFQTCTNIIFLAGQSKSSMFLENIPTYEDLAFECATSFGKHVVPRPTELNDMYHFAPGDALVNVANASRILFTNGLQDMWSGGSYLEDLSDSILAINFVEGAHHSDLTHTSLVHDKKYDTDEIREGKEKIAQVLGTWIDEIKEGMVK